MEYQKKDSTLKDNINLPEEAIKTFETYHKALIDQLKLDEMTVKDCQMELPSRRHYWLGELFRQKSKQSQLKKKRQDTLNVLREEVNEYMASNPNIKVSLKEAESKINNHIKIQRIDQEIYGCQFLIEYLERVESNFRSLSYDIKNLIEIMKLETL